MRDYPLPKPSQFDDHDYTDHFARNSPAFPMIGVDEIRRELNRLNISLRRPIRDAVSLFMHTHGIADPDLQNETQERIWQLAVKAGRYNAIYFISRNEARQSADFVREHAGLIDVAGRLIDEHGGTGPIVNYVLHQWVADYPGDLGRQVKAVTHSTPPHAIQGYGQNVIAVRAKHFHALNAEQCFRISDSEVHDWHDLAHVLAAAASDGVFGVKYHDGLHLLPRHFRALTEGQGAADGTGPMFSDGLMFSHLSRALFDRHHVEQGRALPVVHELIAAELTAYLAGRHHLRHPDTGDAIAPNRAVHPLELAVCLQNKRYERRAAEAETVLLVRGTPDGLRGNPEFDPLLKLTRSERLLYIAELHEPLHFEARNLCRHRAHEDALGRYAHTICGSALGIGTAMLDFYHLADLRRGREINLYQLVADVLEKAA